MRRRVTVAALLCVCLAAHGGRELENVELIQALAVDAAQEGSGVVLTAMGGGEDAPLYRAEGEDVVEAQENLKWVGDRRLELTHVTHVVLGRDVALAPVLEREVTHRKSGYGARVWLAQDGEAQALLSGGEDPAGRLGSLEENAGVEAPTLLEALSRLKREGEVRLPVVALSREGELSFAGYETRGGTAP